MDVARIHILVVDDYVDAADSTVELLTIWGYDAIASYTEAAALESARIHRPEVVLLELAMPCMDGFQFAGLFRDLFGCFFIPIIAVSGHFSQAYRSSASEAGIHQYLLKPVGPKCLKDLLARTIVATAVPSSLSNDTANCLAVKRSRPKRRILRGVATEPYSAPMVKEWVGL
jgi:CheY-like chemotaxis protein